MGIHAVPPHERIVVFRLGRADASSIRGPGLVFLIPIIDHGVRVDLREQLTVVTIQATTQDDVPVTVDLNVVWQIVDPLKSVVNVADFRGALSGFTTTTLRKLIGETKLEDLRFRSDRVIEQVRPVLDATIERWGGRLSQVEVHAVLESSRTSD